jgi:hypothetical protein
MLTSYLKKNCWEKNKTLSQNKDRRTVLFNVLEKKKKRFRSFDNYGPGMICIQMQHALDIILLYEKRTGYTFLSFWSLWIEMYGPCISVLTIAFFRTTNGNGNKTGTGLVNIPTGKGRFVGQPFTNTSHLCTIRLCAYRQWQSGNTSQDTRYVVYMTRTVVKMPSVHEESVAVCAAGVEYNSLLNGLSHHSGHTHSGSSLPPCRGLYIGTCDPIPENT